jgi:hypothetical protein
MPKVYRPDGAEQAAARGRSHGASGSANPGLAGLAGHDLERPLSRDLLVCPPVGRHRRRDQRGTREQLEAALRAAP